MSTPSTGLPPAGWYPDPELPGRMRWWDGTAWATPQPGTVTPPAVVGQPTNGYAIAGFILGILAVTVFYTGNGALAAATAGVILSAVGITRARRTNHLMQLARWGLGLSAAGALLGIAWNLLT